MGANQLHLLHLIQTPTVLAYSPASGTMGELVHIQAEAVGSLCAKVEA